MEAEPDQGSAYYVLQHHTIDSGLVDAVWKDIESRLDTLDVLVANNKDEHSVRHKPATYTVLEWTASCNLVAQKFDQEIRPYTELASGFNLKYYSLNYFHKKVVTSGILDAAPAKYQGHFVVICIRYNSRFPRLIERTMAGSARPLSGSTSEMELKAGNILLYDGARNFSAPQSSLKLTTSEFQDQLKIYHESYS